MTSGIRISNLPELANENLIKEFLSKATSEIESIKIYNNYADVILKDLDDLQSVLMLNKQEILGFTITISLLDDIDSDPEILLEDTQKDVLEDIDIYTEKLEDTIEYAETTPTEHFGPKICQKKSDSSGVANSEQLKELLRHVSLKPREDIEEDNPIAIMNKYRVVELLGALTLILLFVSDLFGY
jgi:RNA recognition motif. (a.k.a. RRM, RBD, or RNP domain)